jgi:hypothetical protein
MASLKVNALLRKAAERIGDAIADLIDIFTPQECGQRP